mmetsp:Transcript_16658/g.20361  ORF Transcript_16658/g.20361 Transcript_16658/m.20361 type:complete len:495 (-) Transcript_16658:155-1639(-)
MIFKRRRMWREESSLSSAEGPPHGFSSNRQKTKIRFLILLACCALISVSVYNNDYDFRNRELQEESEPNNNDQLVDIVNDHLSEVKQEEEERRTALNSIIEGDRKLNVLTLGGSVTWGASIDDRNDAFPFLLHKNEKLLVTNLAIRATGSYYPAQCISSMLRDREEANVDSNFDVIIFEFSINGLHGFELLFKRLKERFPNALMIYIDLYSMRSGAWPSYDERTVVKEGGGFVYRFPNKGDPTENFDFRNEFINTKDDVPEEVMNLYADDNHHLGVLGHALVEEKIVELMLNHGDFSTESPPLGSWLGGDRCISWFEDGKIPDMIDIIEGGKMNEWDEEKNKWAIEVQENGTILEYDHDDEEDAPIKLQHMTKCDDAQDPLTSRYPPVVVRIDPEMAISKEAMKQAVSGQLEVKVESNHQGVTSIPDGWTYINAMHKKRRSFHITEISHAGILKPGKNFIYIYPIIEMNRAPFRVTATIMCEACGRLGWNGDVW